MKDLFTRTRCSFEVAAHDLGMNATYLAPLGSQIGKKESIADTARVLGRMFDGIEYRGFGQAIVEELAQYAGVPVWNGLTNEFHPTSDPADFLTIQEHFGCLKGINFVYLGTYCSEKELGLALESSGVLVFPNDTPLGISVRKLYLWEDTILTIDNKSITHRPDLWNHFGFAAKELASQLQLPLNEFPFQAEAKWESGMKG